MFGGVGVLVSKGGGTRREHGLWVGGREGGGGRTVPLSGGILSEYQYLIYLVL